MRKIKVFSLSICSMIILVLLTGCASPFVLSRQQVVDSVWNTLGPNTFSHNRTAWEIVTAKIVLGQEVKIIFDNANNYCGIGFEPTKNLPIFGDTFYWYIEMKPRPATPKPEPTDYSPTAPAWIPEPFIVNVEYLVDDDTGQIIARNIHCIVY